MKSRLSKAEYELLASFRYALRRFLHFSEEAAGAVGLTPQQYQALLAVKGFPGRDRVTVGNSRTTQIRHHSAVGLVDRMVSHEWLVRLPATDDRRQVHVALTTQAAAQLEQLAAIHKEELRRLAPQLRMLLTRLNGEEEA